MPRYTVNRVRIEHVTENGRVWFHKDSPEFETPLHRLVAAHYRDGAEFVYADDDKVVMRYRPESWVRSSHIETTIYRVTR